MNDGDGFSYPNKIDFFGTTLRHICHFTEVDLRYYQEYDKYSEYNLRNSHKTVSDELKELIDNKDERHHEDLIGYFAEDFNELGNIYPAFHRKSMVITLYNFFEHQLKTLCSELNKLLPVNASVKYFKNEDIKEYRKFLIRECEFNIVKGGNLWSHWEDMLKVEQIRHVLVHSEGEIGKNKARLQPIIESYCRRNKKIRLIRNTVIIDEDYVGDLVKNLISFFELLDIQISAFIRRYTDEHGSFEVELPPGASRTPL